MNKPTLRCLRELERQANAHQTKQCFHVLANLDSNSYKKWLSKWNGTATMRTAEQRATRWTLIAELLNTKVDPLSVACRPELVLAVRDNISIDDTNKVVENTITEMREEMFEDDSSYDDIVDIWRDNTGLELDYCEHLIF